MRRFPLILFLWCACGVFAYGETPALARAREEAERIRQLVDAGAAPASALERAEEAFREARDIDTLNEVLYGKLTADDLSIEQSDAMVAAAERHLARQQKLVDQRRQLVDEGVVARSTLTPFLEELDARRRTLDQARARSRVLTELAQLILQEQEAALPQADEEALQAGGPLAERFEGQGQFSIADFRNAMAAYERQFRKPIPVSAFGETALHRSMGYDHRGRVDVALNPDGEEGLWLRQYLQKAGIPYFAFRAAIRGKSTAPHIHIGPPSLRLRSAD